jgi:hypothetical protein
MSKSQDELITEFKKHGLDDLCMQYFIMERKITDEIRRHNATINNYNEIKHIIRGVIHVKQDHEHKKESPTIIIEELEEETDDETDSIKTDDIELLSDTDDDGI